MIASDQPTCFPENVIARVSSRQDGTVLDRTIDNTHEPHIAANRRSFCDSVGVDYDTCAYQVISYEPNTPFDTIVEVSSPDTNGVHADVLYTEVANVGLFLPVADCIGTVIYDPDRHALALAHIGRHASLANTLAQTIDFFTDKGSDVRRLIIWMAPAVRQSNYRMEYFDAASNPEWRDYCKEQEGGYYLDLYGYNCARAIEAGVPREHIHMSPVDTATNANYFSHSQGDASGRFAVLATMKP